MAARRPPSRALVLAMDIGSSSVRAALFNDRGERIMRSSAARKYSLLYTRDGGAELNPTVILRAARSCVKEALRAPRDLGNNVPLVAISGSAMWHGLLGLDARGEAMTPVFTWADSRSHTDAARLRGELSERELQLRTGCMLRAPYWPAKLRWLRRTQPALFRRVKRWISPGTWIFKQLFAANCESHSMASGTGLYNLQRGAWDEELCALVQIKPRQLTRLGDRGLTTPPGLSEVVVFAPLGDGAASNLGSGADRSGSLAINIGTSAAVRGVRVGQTATGKIPRGLFEHVVDEDRRLLGGAISNAGNLREWLLRQLSVRDAERALQRRNAAEDALIILPFLVAERAPTWPEHLPATITGLTPATSSAEIFRAAITSSFYRLADIFDLLREELRVEEVIVSGGILRSPASLKILADCLGHDLRICRERESSLRGAAIYALEHLGYDVPRLPPGPIVRHQPLLAKAHRARRRQQQALEARFAPGSGNVSPQ